MANAVTIFDSMPQLPADVTAFFDEESNIAPKQTVPTLSYEGKVWTIGLNGEKTKLMRKNQDGDDEPLSVFRGIILDYAKRRGRTYYEGAYDPAKVAMPACWSDDGITPAESVSEDIKTNKTSHICAKCPMSVKGSKVTEQGKQVTACSEHRMVVLIPSARLDFEPLRMKIAITSDYDGKSPDHEAQGWFAFNNYTDMLCAKQVAHTAMLVTKMKFDPNVAYPKVLFSVDKWLDGAQLQQIIPVVKSDKVAQLIAGTFTPNGIDGERIKKEAIAEAKANKPDPVTVARREAEAEAAAAKAFAEATAAKAAAVDDDDEEVQLPGTPAAATAGKANGKTPPAAKPATAAKSPKAAATPAAVPDEEQEGALKDLLAEWAP